jgi:ATP-binding cassette, subfamily B, vacuolar membrane transporter HMT1/ACLQ
MPWVSLLIYVFLRFLQGNMGLVGALRSYAWIPVGQVPPPLSTFLTDSIHIANYLPERSNMSIRCHWTFI